jgi:thioredoxin-like negative regulator of GroEL
MLKISVFGKQGCGRCDSTKSKLTHFLSQWQLERVVQLVFHDMDTEDGRAEGAFYDVAEVPMTVVEREGREVARWDGEIPDSHAVRLVLQEGAHAAAN